MHLKAKEELWKLKYFTVQKYNLQEILLKETKILQNIVIPGTNYIIFIFVEFRVLNPKP